MLARSVCSRLGSAPLFAAAATALLITSALLPARPALARARADGAGPAQNTTTMQDWLRHPHDDSYYQESWTTILRSRQGHVLYLNFIYTNIGVFSGSTAVNASLALPGKMARSYRYDYTTKDFVQSAGTGRIAIGPNSMTLQGKTMTLHVAEKGFACDLTLAGWVPGVKHHGGRLWLDDSKKKWVETYFHVPRADVKGKLTVGGQAVDFEGDGYVDHMVQNELGTSYSTRWYTLRFFAPDHTVAFLVWDMPKEQGGQRVARALATDRNGVLAFTDTITLTTDQPKKDPKGHRYNTHFRFATPAGPSGWTIAGQVTGNRLHDRDAVIERLSWAERKVAGLVAGNPVFYRLEGATEVTLGGTGHTPVPLSGVGLIESVVMQEE